MDAKYIANFLRRLPDGTLVEVADKKEVAAYLRKLSDDKLVSITMGNVELEPEPEAHEETRAPVQHARPILKKPIVGKYRKKSSAEIVRQTEKVLQFIAEYGSEIKAGDIISGMDIPRPHLSRILATLVKEKNIIKIGDGKSTKYVFANGVV